MVAVPVVIPDTMPVLPTMAIVVSLLLHAPPVTVSAIVIAESAQRVARPVMLPANGNESTTTIAVTELPATL